jgi:hypothetical protein
MQSSDRRSRQCTSQVRLPLLRAPVSVLSEREKIFKETRCRRRAIPPWRAQTQPIGRIIRPFLHNNDQLTMAFLVAHTQCQSELSTAGSQCFGALMVLVACAMWKKDVYVTQLQSVSSTSASWREIPKCSSIAANQAKRKAFSASVFHVRKSTR